MPSYRRLHLRYSVPLPQIIILFNSNPVLFVIQFSNRIKRFEVRLTEDEYNQLLNIETKLGITRTEYIRLRILNDTKSILINSAQLLEQLNILGAEIGRSGKNINQLALHANILNNRVQLNEAVIIEFNGLFRDYVRIRDDTEKSLRQIIRLIRP